MSTEEQRLAWLLKNVVPEPPVQLSADEITAQPRPGSSARSRTAAGTGGGGGGGDRRYRRTGRHPYVRLRPQATAPAAGIQHLSPHVAAG